ncbi:MAG: hypothetical protein WCE30_19480 [Mycobacterium sp.]
MKLRVCVVAAVLAGTGIPVAHAAPPNFPDFTGFALVTDTHQVLYRGGPQQTVKFSTSDGVYCGISALDGTGPVTRCYGPLPGLRGLPVTADSTASSPCDFGVAQLRSANAGVVSSFRGECPSDLAGADVMTVGQKVVVGSTTCGITAGNVTACLDKSDGGHGFVLQPSGPWTF